MHPVLLRLDTGPDALGTITISSYFGMVAIGFCLAIFLMWRVGGKRGLPRDSLLDLGLYMIIFGVLGARLLHVIADGQFWNYVHWCTDPSAVVWDVTRIECRSLHGVWDAAQQVCRPLHPEARSVWERCTLWLQFWQGGLAFYGGFLLASAYGIYFIRKEGLPLATVLDMTGWAIPFGLAWGRMGCFLNGCCFGAVCSSSPSDAPWWSATFPGGRLGWSPAWRMQLHHHLVDVSSTHSLPVYPTQLWESAAALAIAALAYFVLEPRKRFAGEVFLSSALLYAGARFVIEFWRADARGEALGFSTSQLIAIGVTIVVISVWPVVRRASERRTNHASPTEHG